ncbi:HNH endonuclease family protein [Gordonia asplenii]
MTGYGRSQFGRAWSDAVTVDGGHNGCDTRDDILKRDLTNITFVGGVCKVASGTLNDPYTGKTIKFVRGDRTSMKVQIDHVVPLADAWQKGAQQWTADKRLNLANDPRNLLAVDGSTNQAKGAGDAATWLPPNKSFRCTYVSKQIAIKAAYRLWVTQAEHDAMERMLATCK